MNNTYLNDNQAIIDTITAVLDGDVVDKQVATQDVDVEQVTQDILDMLDEGVNQDFKNFDEVKFMKLCQLLDVDLLGNEFAGYSSDEWFPFAAGVAYFYNDSTSAYEGDLKKSLEIMVDKINRNDYLFYLDVYNDEDLGHAVYEDLTSGKGLPYPYSDLEDFIDYEKLGRATYEDCCYFKGGKSSYDYYGFFGPMNP